MKNAVLLICGVMALLFGLEANAQKPYNKEEMNERGALAKNTKASISDFVSWVLDEPEGEVLGPMSEAWDQYLHNQPLEKGVTILLDEKNGFFRYEVDFDKKHEDDEGVALSGNSLYVEMCLWNCADGRHKVFGVNIVAVDNGKPSSGGQYDGYNFHLYDKDTHKIYMLDAIDTDEMSNLIPTQEWQYDGKQWYYATDYVTGEKKRMNSEEFDQWWANRPEVVLTLPRIGKNIKATVYSPTGNTEREFVWDGYRFHLSK